MGKKTDKIHDGIDNLSKKVDYVSDRLFWIALSLALVTFVVVFSLVQIIAILPVITLVHTAWAGLALALILGGFVYFIAARPMDVVDTASWSLWLAKLVLKMARKQGDAETASQPPVQNNPGDAGAANKPPGTEDASALPDRDSHEQ
ncbi:MAG: hypothetical protein JNN26_23675 [Candidatus Obscuribacter sp.]|mgnify:FL=1|nr:hypothetical protein [Candidatus Obscuribacter sp.]MBL8085647.1 hypothetical protein [Candidatus Obscuribacter sp.]